MPYNTFFSAHMTKAERFFDSIAKGITSLGAVVFVMLMVITAMVFFSHTLFLNAFPVSMANWEKLAAAWFMALGWEATVLITTVNTKHINPNVPGVMAICSGIILLFFLEAFDFDVSVLIICQRWFVSILVATINYLYSDLFYSKWKERSELDSMPLKLNEAESKVIQLERTVIEAQSNLNKLSELQRFRSQIEKELTCPHCKTMQTSYGVLHAHKGHCSQNPIRKAKIELAKHE